MRLLLNIDAGEHDDEPQELYALADVVHIACGGHAGDLRSMERVLRACKRHGTTAGAHPSFPDREGFGRRAPPGDPGESARAFGHAVLDQLQSLRAIADRVGVPIRSVKPHGALYHAANRDPRLALAIGDAARVALGLGPRHALVGPPDGELQRVATELGLRYLREGFADRGMLADGSLVPRGEPGALLTDPIEARLQARRLVATGNYETLCVHGDTPGAVEIARAVHEELRATSE